MKNYRIFANGFDMGIFSAADEDAALEAYAQEAGYQSLADMEEQLESEKADEYEVIEVEATASDKKTKEENEMKKFTIYANGFNMGVFQAEDEDTALEAYAQEAGYESFADMNEQLESKADYEIVEV